eukprot:481107_1
MTNQVNITLDFFTTYEVTKRISVNSIVYSLDTIDICGFVAVFFGWFICAPIISYYLYKIQQISDESIMKHRHLLSIYTLNGVILCNIIFLELFIAIFMIWRVDIIYNNVMQWTLYLINGIFILPIFILFALKTYLLYFEQKYQLSIMNMTWLKQINSEITDYYIAKRQTFGNFNYLVKISFIPYSLQILCYIFA